MPPASLDLPASHKFNRRSNDVEVTRRLLGVLLPPMPVLLFRQQGDVVGCTGTARVEGSSELNAAVFGQHIAVVHLVAAVLTFEPPDNDS